MSKLFTARKALVAAAFIIICVILFKSPSSSLPSTPATVVDNIISKTENLADDVAAVPTRAYPPPSPPKKPLNGQQIVQDISSKPLRDRLRYQFPYDLESKFPAYIWQTWKTAPASGEFEERLRPYEASWSENHPGFVHEVIIDEAAVHLINYLYAAVPEVIEAYTAMPVPVIKADFFRYLILLARGGIYSDIDTHVLKSAVEWLPESLDRSTVGLVVGIEADPDRPDWKEWYARRIQFCQWTIQSKPGHPVLVDIVATITEDTLQMKKQGLLAIRQQPPKSIMEWTGPGVWTDAIFNYFNDKDYFDFSQRTTNVSYSEFFAITQHKKVGDVVVLPITSFSPGVQQMGAEDVDHPMAFVKHEFDGRKQSNPET